MSRVDGLSLGKEEAATRLAAQMMTLEARVEALELREEMRRVHDKHVCPPCRLNHTPPPGWSISQGFDGPTAPGCLC